MSQYATRAELATFGMPAAWFDGISNNDQDAHLVAASAVADSYLSARYKLPLTAYGSDIKKAVCDIAVGSLCDLIGYSPQDGSDATISRRKDDAIQWFRDVARMLANPHGVTDSTVDTDESGYWIDSDTARGWGNDPSESEA